MDHTPIYDSLDDARQNPLDDHGRLQTMVVVRVARATAAQDGQHQIVNLATGQVSSVEGTADQARAHCARLNFAEREKEEQAAHTA